MVDLAAPRPGRARTGGREPQGGGGRTPVNFGNMTAAHFIFIPAVLLVGMVLGWILGSRAAQDAFAAELKRREERAQRKNADRGA